MSSQQYYVQTSQQQNSESQGKKKRSANNIQSMNSPDRNNYNPQAQVKLMDILQYEKDHDRQIMSQALAEYCDKSLNQQSCPLGLKCFKAHKDNNPTLRRSPFTQDNSQLRYIAALCLNPDSCTRKENCSFSHSQEEIKYHPTIFKTELCQLNKACQQKSRCQYAHSPSELRNAQKYYLLQSQSQNSNMLAQASGSGNTNSVHIDQNLSKGYGISPIQSRNNIQGSSGNLQDLMSRKNGAPPAQNGEPKRNNDDVIAYIDLYNFKTQQCKIPYQHNPKKCFFYHEAKKDRRRHLGTYTSEICPYVINSATHYECPMADGCSRSHNRVEEFYHPEKYKVKFCSSYPDKVDSCDYGDMCAFAHSEQEVTVDQLDKFEKDVDFYMFHFKTVWCPYSDTTHARDACVYAHNWQDFRRKPHVFEYEKEQCPQWETKNFIQTYADGCKHEYRCKYSHGWKEQEYHPLNYKMHACRQNDGCQKPHCPYYHSDHDKRQPINQFFKISPKNRGTTVNQTQLYQPIFLNLLFNVPSRICQTYIDQLTGQQQQVFVGQQIYGCGPQSIPIIDPKVVMSYQQSLMMKSQSTTTNQLQSQILAQQQELINLKNQKLALSQSNPNYFNQHQQMLMSQINGYQLQQNNSQQNFARAQSQNAMLTQLKKVPSNLSTQSNEFKRIQGAQMMNPQMMVQGNDQMLQPPPGFEELGQGRFQVSQSVPSFQHFIGQDLAEYGNGGSINLKDPNNLYTQMANMSLQDQNNQQQNNGFGINPQGFNHQQYGNQNFQQVNQPYKQQTQQQQQQLQYQHQPSQFSRQNASQPNLIQSSYLQNTTQNYGQQVQGYALNAQQQQLQQKGSGVFNPQQLQQLQPQQQQQQQQQPPSQQYPAQYWPAQSQQPNQPYQVNKNLFKDGVLGSNPIDQGYMHHRQSEDETKLDVDGYSPFSDDEEEQDEDENELIQDIFNKRSNKKFTKSSEQSQIDIDEFLSDNKLSALKPIVAELKITTLEQLKEYSAEEIRGFLGPENKAMCEQLIEALNKLTTTV